MQIQPTYYNLLKMVVENNPIEVATNMRNTGYYADTSVTPEKFIEFTASAKTTDPDALAKLVAGCLNVTIMPTGMWFDYLSEIKAAYLQMSFYQIVYEAAVYHFDSVKKSLDPSVLAAYERNLRDKEHLPFWAKAVIGGLVILAIIGGLVYLIKTLFKGD